MKACASMPCFLWLPVWFKNQRSTLIETQTSPFQIKPINSMNSVLSMMMVFSIVFLLFASNALQITLTEALCYQTFKC
jgi:hypothetical protein